MHHTHTMSVECRASYAYVQHDPRVHMLSMSLLCMTHGSVDHHLHEKWIALQVKVGSYVAVYKHQKAVEFNLYACSNNSDRYVDSAAMKKIGNVTLQITDPTKVTDPDAYSFTVSFRLGGSELTATAIDNQTNLEVQTTVIFVAE